MPEFTKLFPAGLKRFGLMACAAALFFIVSSCEDDPIVEPKGETKTGGSYGGRLAQPAQPTSTSGKATGKTNTVNPEVF